MTDAEKIEKLKAALAWTLCDLYALQEYMARPENGNHGVECAVCRREWFHPEEAKRLDEFRALLDAA